jgi:hypothetical protein
MCFLGFSMRQGFSLAENNAILLLLLRVQKSSATGGTPGLGASYPNIQS